MSELRKRLYDLKINILKEVENLDIRLKLAEEVLEIEKSIVAITDTHGSTELPYKEDDLLKAYQAGCIEGLDDCCDFGHDDLKELISDSIKWLKRYKDKAIT